MVAFRALGPGEAADSSEVSSWSGLQGWATHSEIALYWRTEAVVHVCNEILLSHKKKPHISISSNEVDEPRAYCTESSKLEKEKQMSYVNTRIWNLEGWYWWICLLISSGDVDKGNKFMDKGGREEEKGVGCIERATWKHIRCCCCC